MCITTWHKKTLQLGIRARHAKTNKSGISPLQMGIEDSRTTLLYLFYVVLEGFTSHVIYFVIAVLEYQERKLLFVG